MGAENKAWGSSCEGGLLVGQANGPYPKTRGPTAAPPGCVLPPSSVT